MVGALLGIHLGVPFIALTFSKVRYDSLIPSFRRLYEEFGSVNPSELLDVEKPALDFLPPGFVVEKRYPDPIVRSVASAASENREEVTLVLRFILPRLREALERQRGKWMGFGSTAPENARLLSYNQDKLQHAPINNIASE